MKIKDKAKKRDDGEDEASKAPEKLPSKRDLRSGPREGSLILSLLGREADECSPSTFIFRDRRRRRRRRSRDFLRLVCFFASVISLYGAPHLHWPIAFVLMSFQTLSRHAGKTRRDGKSRGEEERPSFSRGKSKHASKAAPPSFGVHRIRNASRATSFYSCLSLAPCRCAWTGLRPCIHPTHFETSDSL